MTTHLTHICQTDIDLGVAKRYIEVKHYAIANTDGSLTHYWTVYKHNRNDPNRGPSHITTTTHEHAAHFQARHEAIHCNLPIIYTTGA
jgi:hypothetical protein